MKKTIFAILLFVSVVTSAQVPAGFISYYSKISHIGLATDSSLLVPYRDTTYTPPRIGAMNMRPADSSLYVGVSKTAGTKKWQKIAFNANIVDTTGRFITGVYRKAATDSVFYYKGGVPVFAFKDSTGGGGTNYWTATGNDIYKNNSGNVGIGTTTPAYLLDVNGKYGIRGMQLAYYPNQASFPNSFAIGTGLQQMITSGSSFPGYGNTTLGIGAGDSITHSYNNTLIGALAGNRLKGGFFNTYVGIAAGMSGQNATENTYVGMAAAQNNRGFYNVVVGTGALLNCDSCETNTVIGAQSARLASFMKQSTAINYRSLQSLDSGFANSAIDYRSMEALIKGDANVGHGNHSLSVMTYGNYNTATGFYAGNSLLTGRHNSYFGAYAGANVLQKTNAVSSTAIGAHSYNTRDYEVSVGSDSTKYLVLKATDSAFVTIPRITSFNYVMVYDSATKRWGYMPISSLPSGGGGGGGTPDGNYGNVQVNRFGFKSPGGDSLSYNNQTFSVKGKAAVSDTLSTLGVLRTGVIDIAAYGTATRFYNDAARTGKTAGIYFHTTAGGIQFLTGSLGIEINSAGGGAKTRTDVIYGTNHLYIDNGSHGSIYTSAASQELRLGAGGTENQFTILPSGRIGIGATAPTAGLHLKAGTAAANGGPFKLTVAGAVPLTTPELGVIETSADSTALYYTSRKGGSTVRQDLTRQYKIYVAMLSQSGTSNPTATVLENTVGTITWTRNDVGDYTGTLSGAFPAAKFIQYSFASPSGFNNYQYAVERIDDNSVSLFLQSAGSPFELSSLGFNIPIEIKIYY